MWVFANSRAGRISQSWQMTSCCHNRSTSFRRPYEYDTRTCMDILVGSSFRSPLNRPLASLQDITIDITNDASCFRNVLFSRATTYCMISIVDGLLTCLSPLYSTTKYKIRYAVQSLFGACVDTVYYAVTATVTAGVSTATAVCCFGRGHSSGRRGRASWVPLQYCSQQGRTALKCSYRSCRVTGGGRLP